MAALISMIFFSAEKKVKLYLRFSPHFFNCIIIIMADSQASSSQQSPTQQPQTSTGLPPQPTLDMNFPFGAQPDISKVSRYTSFRKRDILLTITLYSSRKSKGCLLSNGITRANDKSSSAISG
jgi:hypothetical protein